jgi:hypothetical protein
MWIKKNCLLLQDMYDAIVLQTMEMLRPQVKYVSNACQKAQTISQIAQEYYNLRPKCSSIEYLKPYLHKRIIQSFDAHEIYFSLCSLYSSFRFAHSIYMWVDQRRQIQ